MRKLLPLLAVAALAIALSGCGGHASSGSETGDAGSGAVVTVRVGTVSVHRFEDIVIATGQWRSSGDVVVPAPFAATIEALETRVGDAVARGQHLGWLLTRESRATLRGAELLREQASTPTERAEADRALALARRDLIRVPLVSPRAGIVTHRATETGAEVGEGSEVITLTPRAALVCEAHVPAASASRVRAGQQATLHEDGADASRPARVQRVLPSVSAGDQSRLVWLAPEDSGPPPALDRFVTATIQVGAPHNALAVPDSAIVEDDLTGATQVAVIGADSTATWTTVTLGAHAGGWRELVRAALPAGARVVVVGQHGLPDRTRVKTAR
jgi:multidrug efflux pump subunit AcrA (membrane-fusion protein)